MFAKPHSHSLSTVIGALALCLSLTQAASAQDGEAARQCGLYPAPAAPSLAPVAASEDWANAQTPFGEVDLPLAPGAALGMYTTDVDILIWLGFPLAQSQPIRGDGGYQTFPCFFPQAALEGITPFANYPEYNYELLLNARPDFILNGLGYDEAVNARLPQIAPTYSVNAYDGRSWQEHFRETAEALGRSDYYRAWLGIYETRLAEVKTIIAGNENAVVTPLGDWRGVLSTRCYTGVECTVFRDLGLTIFAGALENDGAGVEFSAEEAGALKDVDFAFTMAGLDETGLAAHREWLEEANKNPVWSQLDMVRNNRVVPFEMEMVFGSPSGQLAFLEVVAQALGGE